MQDKQYETLSEETYQHKMEQIHLMLETRREAHQQVVSSMARVFEEMLPKGSMVRVDHFEEAVWYIHCTYHYPDNPRRVMVVEYRAGQGFSTCVFPK